MTNSGVLTPAAREYLAKCLRTEVTAGVHDRDWGLVLDLQRLRYVSVKPVTKYVGRVVPTEAGRAELAKVAK